MLNVKEQSFHGGDVQGYAVVSLPAGVKKVNSIDGRIIARGETSGHAHILTGDVELYELDGQIFAIVGQSGAYHQHIKEAEITEATFTVNKNISNCDHTKDCPIAPGTYALGLDRQYDPHEEVWTANLD